MCHGTKISFPVICMKSQLQSYVMLLQFLLVLEKEKFIVLFYQVLLESVTCVIGNQTSKAFATVKQHIV